MKHMKSMVVLLVVLVAVWTAMAAPTPLSIGYTDQKPYTDGFDGGYKKVVEMTPLWAQMGLLKVESNLVLGPLTIMVTIDNVTASNVLYAIQVSAVCYHWFYERNGWPDEAIIYVTDAGERQLGTSHVYSKWVEDDIKANRSMNAVFGPKVANATRVWI